MRMARSLALPVRFGQMTKILVTGSSDGIGKQAAIELARQGAQVIVHGRNRARAETAVEAVPGAQAWVCDFESLDEVRAAAGRLPPGIDVLVNNAGVYLTARRVTQDGYEVTFQVNHLAHFLLTNLLLPSMSEGSRIVNVSSQVHNGAEIDWDDPMGERHWSGYGAYGQSKLANVLFTRELARRQEKATVNALHPGVIATKLLSAGFGAMGGGSLSRGAETPVYLASSPEVAGITGKYFVNRRESQPSARALDDGAARRLWDVSERLCRM
jgi:NAD(P)-dependent dehydrogenase (short-subunit alcohol dehydrogenase family)